MKVALNSPYIQLLASGQSASDNYNDKKMQAASNYWPVKVKLLHDVNK